jgi:FAD:protein FMN transferase
MIASARFAALGTSAHVAVTDAAALPAAEQLLREALADLDVACSRFRADSALSLLNQRRRAIVSNPTLLAAIAVALRAARATDGLVDPTLGGSMIAIGYDRRFADVPATISSAVRPRPATWSWRDVTVDAATGEVSLPAGAQLDLGATAKAWAADTAAERIAAACGCGVLVNLGGDLAVAGACPPGGWRVRVADDHAATTGGQVVSVRSGGLATSSTTVRRWRRGGLPLHHVIDPVTGLPPRPGWRYVSVTAGSCVDANTASTAALVQGPEAARWLAELELPSRLVAADGSITTVAGWPADRELEAAS